MSILFDPVHLLVLPLVFVTLLPPRFLLHRQLGGLRFTIMALAQTLSLAEDLYPHDYVCSQALHPHSHHLPHRFQPSRVADQPPEVYFSVA